MEPKLLPEQAAEGEEACLDHGGPIMRIFLTGATGFIGGHLLHKLSEREQRVLQLYYEFDLSLKEIAATLDLTEARICQINKAAMTKLRDLLESADR